MLDLIDLIKEKRFIGQEFLTWLWWKSEERGGSVDLPEYGDIIVTFEKHMLLEFGEGESAEKLTCSGLRAELYEARTGLQMGKKLERARVKIGVNDREYNFTFVATLMEFRNVRLPKTEETEDGGREEIEGMVLERVYLFENLVQTINALFRAFLQKRASNEWGGELQKVRRWVADNRHLIS